MLEKLSSQSKTTEVSDVLNQSISAWKQSNLTADAYLQRTMLNLEEKSVLLTGAIKRLKAASELEAKDEIRDNATRALFALVNGGIFHPDNAVKTASVAVNRILSKHGLGLVEESYATESALLNSLLKDLAATNLVVSIGAISGCAELIAQLQAAQTDFESSRLAYESSKAIEGTYTNASTLKSEIVKLFNSQLLAYLAGMLLADEATYGNYTRTVSQLVADNNVNVKKRSITNKKEETETEA